MMYPTNSRPEAEAAEPGMTIHRELDLGGAQDWQAGSYTFSTNLENERVRDAQFECEIAKSNIILAKGPPTSGGSHQ